MNPGAREWQVVMEIPHTQKNEDQAAPTMQLRRYRVAHLFALFFVLWFCLAYICSVSSVKCFMYLWIVHS
jgi:hypothetical protein